MVMCCWDCLILYLGGSDSSQSMMGSPDFIIIWYFMTGWWCCCSVTQSCLTLRHLWTAARQAPLSFTISRACLNSCALSQWCHPTILSSVIPSSSCLQSFPASWPFLMSQLFTSGGQSIEVSASASIISINIQDWSSLGWIGWISLQCKRLSRVFSNTTVQKIQFFLTQPSLWSNSYIHTWLLVKP